MEWSKQFSKTHQAHYWFNSSTGERSWTDPTTNTESSSEKIEPSTKRQRTNSSLKIAIIIPFREPPNSTVRTTQLQKFTNHMNDNLKDAEFTIFVIEQSNDNRRFNRGKLLN